MVMVGCGPLPLTLLWFARRFPDLECIGLDNNGGALGHAAAFARRMGRPGIRFVHTDGEDYDYGEGGLFMWPTKWFPVSGSWPGWCQYQHPGCWSGLQAPTCDGPGDVQQVAGHLELRRTEASL